MTVSFILIVFMSGLAWFYINENIANSQIDAAKKRNEMTASLIGDLVQNSHVDHLHSNAILVLKKLSDSKIKKSPTYTYIQSIISHYLEQYGFIKINIISRSGRIIYSSVPNETGKTIIVTESFKNALSGKKISFYEADDKAGDGERIISFVPVYHRLKKSEVALTAKDLQQQIIAVVKLDVDVSQLTQNIKNTQTIVLVVWLITLILIIMLFLYLMKYSNDLVSKHAKQIVMQSKSDSVTGLLNRHYFHRLLRRSVTKIVQQNSISALLIIDIDHFRELNAKYDYSFGDEVLKILVHRINRLLGADDVLARTGDDEFSVLIEHPGSTASIQGLAKKILETVNEPVQIDANYIHLTCSIGISIINQDAKEMDELIQHADSALYNAKNSGRNNFELFHRDTGHRHINFYERQYALNKALEENELVLFIQPRINASTAEIVGGEALLRWDNPDYGLVQPLEFLPALEASGLIHHAGKWILDEACKICKHWQQPDIPDITVSVNVSASQFKREDFVDSVKASLTRYELDGCKLEIELTETCLMDNVEYSLNILQALKRMGVKIAIDNFGTGYSSLDYLNRFPVDELKIDRSFVSNVHDRSANGHAAIVTAIMSLAHSLHLGVVAEGVETARELAYMNALGCKIVQGFLFSTPLPVNEFEALLKDNTIIRDVLADVRKKLA